MTFSIQQRIYYSHTDAGGVVYHSRYLDFCEHARTELLRSIGLEQQKLMESDGIGFVVRSCRTDFIAPARLDDLITITAEIKELRGASMVMGQRILNSSNGQVLVTMEAEIVCINKNFAASRIPRQIWEKLRDIQ